MSNSIRIISYLSEDILLFIIKKLEKESHDYLLSPINRIYSFLALKNLYNINKKNIQLFDNININLVLSGYNLINVELTNKDLTHIRFSHTCMNKTILINCNLSYVNLEYTDLQESDLTGANLTGANLTGANLNKTIFSNTQTDDIILDKVNLQTIKFDSNL